MLFQDRNEAGDARKNPKCKHNLVAANGQPNLQLNPNVSRLRQVAVARLERYKADLLKEFCNESAAFLHFARLVVNEAESLAWSTPYTHVFLPALAEEKIQYLRQWTRRQVRVGCGLAAIASANSQAMIQWHELAEVYQQINLATGRGSSSSEAASRALEAARSDTRL